MDRLKRVQQKLRGKFPDAESSFKHIDLNCGSVAERSIRVIIRRNLLLVFSSWVYAHLPWYAVVAAVQVYLQINFDKQ